MDASRTSEEASKLVSVFPGVLLCVEGEETFRLRDGASFEAFFPAKVAGMAPRRKKALSSCVDSRGERNSRFNHFHEWGEETKTCSNRNTFSLRRESNVHFPCL